MLSAKRERELLLEAGLEHDQHDVFELPRHHLLAHTRQEVVVAVHYQDILDMGYIADDRLVAEISEAKAEARAEERDNMADELARALDDLLSLAEDDRLEDSRDIDSTDLIFSSGSVAVARAVRRIVADICKTTIH